MSNVIDLVPKERRRGPAFAHEVDDAMRAVYDARRSLRRAARTGFAADYLGASIAAAHLLRAAADLHAACSAERDARFGGGPSDDRGSAA
jgi:hypothetical protein